MRKKVKRRIASDTKRTYRLYSPIPEQINRGRRKTSRNDEYRKIRRITKRNAQRVVSAKKAGEAINYDGTITELRKTEYCIREKSKKRRAFFGFLSTGRKKTNNIHKDRFTLKRVCRR